MDIKWYTGAGDDGYTGVLGAGRVPKYAVRPDAYGTVDEASACLGLARVQARDARLRGLIISIQRDLYSMMGDLATVPENATRPPWLSVDRLDWLEAQTDALGAEVEMPGRLSCPAIVSPVRPLRSRAPSPAGPNGWSPGWRTRASCATTPRSDT
jgi:cob(I)alamin adenosyltransferase